LACEDTTPLPTWPSTADCTSGENLPLVGSWHGYIENQQAPWDDLTLVISGASVSGGLCGTLKVGGGPAPAPATDPTVGYPDPNAFLQSDQERILPGYAFTLLHTSTDGARVRFSIASTEAWKGWCAMQASYSAGQGLSCNCLPNWASQGDKNQGCKLLDPAGVQDLSVNCAKLADCGLGSVCQCSGSGCTASPNGSFDFDLRFTGDAGEGSSTAAPGPRAQFVRMP
jgi:hypothetical protein